MADNQGSLSFLDKVKLLLGAQKIVSQIPQTNGSTFWQKLDGTKTITGLLMIIAYYALPQFGVKVPDIFLKIGVAWAGVGFAHKFDKQTKILTAVMTALNEANSTINGDKK